MREGGEGEGGGRGGGREGRDSYNTDTVLYRFVVATDIIIH